MGARVLWSVGMPMTVVTEAYEVARYLDVDPATVLAAQVVYDEGWAAEDCVPGHGCTSVSSGRYFGRNMDYAWPENAADYIFHQEVEINGRTLFIEGMAGLLGWLAVRGEDSVAAFNQAPCLRSIRRTRRPGLQWFRDQSIQLDIAPEGAVPDEGDMMTRATASDFLIHFGKGSRRFLAEVFDGQLVWEARRGKIVQANTYQLLDLEADEDWTEDSVYRMRAARAGKGVKASLKAAANEYTADSLVLLPC